VLGREAGGSCGMGKLLELLRGRHRPAITHPRGGAALRRRPSLFPRLQQIQPPAAFSRTIVLDAPLGPAPQERWQDVGVLRGLSTAGDVLLDGGPRDAQYPTRVQGIRRSCKSVL